MAHGSDRSSKQSSSHHSHGSRPRHYDSPSSSKEKDKAPSQTSYDGNYTSSSHTSRHRKHHGTSSISSSKTEPIDVHQYRVPNSSTSPSYVTQPSPSSSGYPDPDIPLIGRLLAKTLTPKPVPSRKVSISNYDEHPKVFGAMGKVSRLDIRQKPRYAPDPHQQYYEQCREQYKEGQCPKGFYPQDARVAYTRTDWPKHQREHYREGEDGYNGAYGGDHHSQ